MKNLIFFWILFLSISISVNAQKKIDSTRLNLMPWPQKVEVKTGYFKIEKSFSLFIKGNPDKRIYKIAQNFLRNIADRTGVFIDFDFYNDKSDSKASLVINIETPGKNLLYVDESYSLDISIDKISIKANNDIGAIRAISTLMQLLIVEGGKYIFPAIHIEDEPRFPWRGLMIDAARHFMPIDVIKRNLDAMAYVKLNVFHWHLSDDQGFRFESKKLPLLTQKGSDGNYYTQEQIKEIVRYASNRGIRVIPEIDVPGHATAIVSAYPEISSKEGIYTIERYAGVFDPTLDPSNEKTYQILDILFTEMADLFPDPYFHIGGDENEGHDWDNNKDIQKFMTKNNLKDNHELQTYFNIRLQKILKKNGKIMMGWDEIMTKNLPKNAIIHSWRNTAEGKDLKQIEAAKKGYQTVLSNGYYIDLLKPASTHYLKDPIPEGIEVSNKVKSKIIGAEATMWSELVTPLTIDSRIWPRTAAIAERYWSAQKIKDVDFMYKRLDNINHQLEMIGITNIRNRDMILRNISNNQSIDALKKLADISEPFKYYSRNNGGKEYKSYSPFTQFADACNVDAKETFLFDKLIDKFNLGDYSVKKQIINYLNKWQSLYSELELISQNAPIIKNVVLPYSKRVSNISKLFLDILRNGDFTISNVVEINKLFNKKEDPLLNLDVNFVAISSLKKLLLHYDKSTQFTLENEFTKGIEGPATDSRGNLFAVNFKKQGTIGKINTQGKTSVFISLKNGSIGNGIRFDKDDNMYVADYVNHNILFIAKGKNKASVYAHEPTANQPNDLTISNSGTIYASDPNWKKNIGNLWKVDKNGFHLQEANMGTTNGIELSPDNNKLYVNESNQRKIWVYDVDINGNLHDKKLFYQFDNFGLDGMRCDNKGNLYICRYGGGKVVVLNPKGEIIRQIKLIGKNPTNITFGGVDNEWCFVTLSDKGNIETFKAINPGKSFH